MWLGGWPQSLTCSEVKHRLTSLFSGWPTTRVLNEQYPPLKQYLFLNRPLSSYKMLMIIMIANA